MSTTPRARYCPDCRANVATLPTPNGTWPEVCQVCGEPRLSEPRAEAASPAGVPGLVAPIVAQHTGRIRYHIEPYEFDADAPRYRGTPTPGTLWERASVEDKSQTNAAGWFIAYYVYDQLTRLSRAYDTHAEALDSLDLAQRLLGYHVVCGLRFTKSGNLYRFAGFPYMQESAA